MVAPSLMRMKWSDLSRDQFVQWLADQSVDDWDYKKEDGYRVCDFLCQNIGYRLLGYLSDYPDLKVHPIELRMAGMGIGVSLDTPIDQIKIVIEQLQGDYDEAETDDSKTPAVPPPCDMIEFLSRTTLFKSDSQEKR